MHCGSAYAGARYWAKGSCIQFGIQVLLIIVIVVILVVTAGAALAGIASGIANCKTVACATGAGSDALKCGKLGGAMGGTQATCEAAKCVWTKGMMVQGFQMSGTCAPKL